MKQSNWPDFLFTLAVRFVCGIVFGGLACFIVTAMGFMRTFPRDDTYGPLIVLGLCVLVSGLIAVFTVPRWQTPWYKSDSLTRNLMADLASTNLDEAKPGSPNVTQSVSIKTMGADGEQHEYSSMEEVPPEIRSEIEALEKEAAQAPGSELSVTETSQSADALTAKIIQRKKFSVCKITDASGVERTYHSLEEMPPEIRAAFADAQDKTRRW